MLFKYTVLFISGLALCFIIITASAQTADEDRQAVQADQQALDTAYHQLRQDQLTGNAAAVEIDQDNIATAEQDFHNDIERIIADDQKVATNDQQVLNDLAARLEQDMKDNPAAVAADQDDITAARHKLQADNDQTITDDLLEVTRYQMALDNGTRQLEQDLKGPSYVTDGSDMIQADRQNIRHAALALQEAQLKLQLDKNTQTQPH